MQSVKDFQNHKYCYVKDVIPKSICEVATYYTIMDYHLNFSPDTPNGQVPGAHSVYTDKLMESILLYALPFVEENTGLSLYPTYSYYRYYQPGDKLVPHTDRPSCEITASLMLGRNYDGESWKLFIENNGYSTEPGDLIIYRGTELNHYRYEFVAPPGSFHSQVFLHYVDQNGPHADCKYDKRPGIGGVLDYS